MTVISRFKGRAPKTLADKGAQRRTQCLAAAPFIITEAKAGRGVTAASAGDHLRAKGLINTDSNKGVGDALGREGLGLWRADQGEYPVCFENVACCVEYVAEHAGEAGLVKLATDAGFESKDAMIAWAESLPERFTAV